MSGAHARAGDAGQTCASPGPAAAAWGVRIQHRRPARGGWARAAWASACRPQPKGRGAAHCQDKAEAPQGRRGPGPELDRDVDQAWSSSIGARGSRAVLRSKRGVSYRSSLPSKTPTYRRWLDADCFACLAERLELGQMFPI